MSNVKDDLSFAWSTPDHNDSFPSSRAKQFIRESIRWHPPKTSVIDGVPFGRVLQQSDGPVNLRREN